MIDFDKDTITLELFFSILKEIKNEPNLYLDIIDSFSENQFKSKMKLIQSLKKLEILNTKSEVIILGSWYGSILVPALSHIVKKIDCIDLNDTVIKIGKNRLLKHYKNVIWRTGDIFSYKKINYAEASLIVNTSCEHMLPIKSWPFWEDIKSGTYFAFQSNNMFNIKGHINCVNSLEDFKNQMPKNAEFLLEDELVDDRGKRFTIIGKII